MGGGLLGRTRIDDLNKSPDLLEFTHLLLPRTQLSNANIALFVPDYNA